MGGRSHLDERTGRLKAVASTSAKVRSGTGTNHQRKFRQRWSSVSGLMAALLIRDRAHCGQQGPPCSLVATALLDECEGLGLRSLCGRLVPMSVVGLRRQHCLVATALLDECEGLHSQ